MNVFITGGAGFIGSHIADKLLARGNRVSVIDNFSTGRRDNLTEHKNLTVHEESICDAETLDKIVKNFAPDIVVHAAASYKDPENWLEDSLTNVAGTANVCTSAIAAGAKRIIYFQTALCYGLKPLEQPITLDHPILPGGSSYAISKTAGEEYIHLSGLDYITFRLANAYGPRNISGPLPTFYHRLTNDKPCFVMDTRRDFVYVDDMIRCILQAIDGVGTGTYHLSSGSDYSIKELFDATTGSLGLDIDVEERPRQPDDVYSILLDPARTKSDFGWEVEVPLEQGVNDTIEYYKAFGIEETYTHLKTVED